MRCCASPLRRTSNLEATYAPFSIFTALLAVKMGKRSHSSIAGPIARNPVARHAQKSYFCAQAGVTERILQRCLPAALMASAISLSM